MKNLFLLSALLFTHWAVAQKTVTDQALDQACTCLKSKPKDNQSTEAMKAAALDCLMSAMTENMIGMAQEFGYDPEKLNEEMGRRIGEKFGMQLFTQCPESVPFLMALSGEVEAKAVAGYEDNGRSKGQFVRLEVADNQAKIIVKTDEGEEVFQWIRPFLGAETLEKQAKSLTGKQVEVEWGEFKRYMPSIKGYAKLKEILGFRVIE